MTLEKVLSLAIKKLKDNKIQEPNLKAKILLCHTLKIKKDYLIIYYNKELTNKEENQYLENINKLLNGIPLQYITKVQEFMKLNFYVDENVLIPRADTEITVENVIEFCNKNPNKQYKILDLCTGSGAIGISIAKYVANCNVVCVDISKSALEIAKRNAIKNKVISNIDFYESDLFKNIHEKFNIIVSNPPYIKTSVINTLEEDVQNEPHIALDGGKDGLKFYKLIINEINDFLEPRGEVFLEIGFDQKDEVIKLIKEKGSFSNIEIKKDLAGFNRMIHFSKQ